MSTPDDYRASSHPDFWETRYVREDHLFGTEPSAFIRAEAERIPPGASVVELGAGEARNLVYLAQRYDHRVTAVDFAPSALAEAKALAASADVPLRTVEADLRTWEPGEQWDAVLITFVQLLPHERPAFYRLIRSCLRPGGILLAEWFRAEHASAPYDRVGPSRTDRLVPVEEVRTHFKDATLHRCEAVDVDLDDGPVLRGHAAVVHVVAQMPQAHP